MGFVTGMSLRFPTLHDFSACGTRRGLAHTSSPVSTTPRDCFTGSCRLVEAADKLPTALYSVKQLTPSILVAAMGTNDKRLPRSTRVEGAIWFCVYAFVCTHNVVIVTHLS